MRPLDLCSENLLYKRVVDLAERIPLFPAIKALELSCGNATLLECLSMKGVDCTGTTFLSRDRDYIRWRDYPAGLKIQENVDLNKSFPFANETFDLVFSTEVIEHIESHANFISESARIIRDGGWLILTTPNTSRLTSRIHHLLSGLLETRRQLIPWDEPIDKMYAYHHRCVEFPHLHWLLWKHGLRIVALEESWVSWPSRVTYIFTPILRLIGSKLVVRRSGINQGDPQPSPEDSEGRTDMLRWLSSKAGLRSEHWCILAQKI